MSLSIRIGTMWNELRQREILRLARKKATSMNLYLVTLCMVFLTLLFCYWVYWSFYPFITVTFDEPPRLFNKIVEAGDDVCYLIKGHKHYDAPTTIITKVHNGHTIQYEPVTSDKSIGPFLVPVCKNIPRNSATGVYSGEISYRTSIGPFGRTVAVRQQIEPFTVVESTDPKLGALQSEMKKIATANAKLQADVARLPRTIEKQIIIKEPQTVYLPYMMLPPNPSNPTAQASSPPSTWMDYTKEPLK
jgi:hypothetical protein